MKAIIDGIRYDTEKATHIGHASSGHPTNDFKYWSADLYVTSNKNFFLAGEGGPFTRYVKSYGNLKGYGDLIEPLTKKEALSWAEQNLSSEDYEEYFSDMIEDA